MWPEEGLNDGTGSLKMMWMMQEKRRAESDVTPSLCSSKKRLKGLIGNFTVAKNRL